MAEEVDFGSITLCAVDVVREQPAVDAEVNGLSIWGHEVEETEEQELGGRSW